MGEENDEEEEEEEGDVDDTPFVDDHAHDVQNLFEI